LGDKGNDGHYNLALIFSVKTKKSFKIASILTICSEVNSPPFSPNLSLSILLIWSTKTLLSLFLGSLITTFPKNNSKTLMFFTLLDNGKMATLVRSLLYQSIEIIATGLPLPLISVPDDLS
jgi:hypothetical protein